ncbi:hypothetical protein H1R20_g15444, partial [Candolleomyces eurysporus]
MPLNSPSMLLSSWIGQGKVYKDVPEVILNEVVSRISLSPNQFNDLLPELECATIAQLCDYPLPRQSLVANFFTANSRFSLTEPNVSLEDLIKWKDWSIPSRATIIQLQAAAGQAILDGSLSIMLSDVSSNTYVPLSVLGLWYHLSEASHAQREWKRASQWLSKSHGVDDNLKARVASIWTRVRWLGKIQGLADNLPVTRAAEFLADGYLSTSHLNAMLLVLRARILADSQLSRSIFVASANLSDCLTNLTPSYPEKSQAEVKSIGQLLAKNPCQYKVLTISYSPPNHWAALLINTQANKVEVLWGDLLNWKQPKKLVEGISIWLKHHLPERQYMFTNALEHAEQNDGISCGVIAMNTIKHYLFGEPLWTNESSNRLRLLEFCDVIDYAFPSQLPPTFPDEHMEDAPIPETVGALQIATLESTPTMLRKPSLPIHPFFHQSKPPKRQHDNSSEAAQNKDIPSQPSKRQRVASQSSKAIQKASGTISRSAAAKKAANEAIANGTFKKSETRWEKYIAKLKVLDPDFEVNESDVRDMRLVRHSQCGSWITQCGPYDSTKLKEHIVICKVKKPTKPSAQTRTLLAMKAVTMAPAVQSQSHSLSQPQLKEWPCPGLTEKDDSRIPQYLGRSPSYSAGGVSELGLAKKMFDVTSLLELNQEERAVVARQQRTTHRWQLNHEEQSIYAIGEAPCEKVVKAASLSEVKPCNGCSGLLKLRPFLTAINRDIPLDENRIHTPHRYQGSAIGQMYAKMQGLTAIVKTPGNGSLLRRVVKSFADGIFDKQPVFVGMIEMMIDKAEQEEGGKGMQNMKYNPAFDKWAHELCCISPEAYRSFLQNFGGRTERSFREMRTKSPAFEEGFSDHLLIRAQKYLKDYGYPLNAPLAMAVDDTKLHPSLSPYFDNKTRKWFLVGSMNGAVEVSDLDHIQAILHDQDESKASKLRLWTLNIPLPAVPPLVLAAKGIPSKLSAPELAEFESKILDILLPAGFQIISLGSDGTSVERDSRKALVCSGYAELVTKHIASPEPLWPPVAITSLQVHGMLLAVIQDAKHLRKTCRNNLMSGARTLVLGRYAIFYNHVRQIATENLLELPLYVRDVEKLDRQDDRAAARLFSAATLEYVINKHCDNLGLTVYLFVFGEMVDAYQNRQIPHVERVKMLFRAHYFKKLWKSFLREAGYSEAQYFISREADDIIDIFINGYMSLLYIYRDHLQGKFPLTPWKNSSEPNEHVFGFLRTMVPDFTMLDLLRLVPKLRVRLMAACKAKHSRADFQKSANGYSHSYLDSDDVNLVTLLCLPTDDEISAAVASGYEEARTLWATLGYFPNIEDEIIHPVAHPVSLSLSAHDEAEDNLDEEPEDDEENSTETERQELESALDEANKFYAQKIHLTETETRLQEGSFAATALNLADLQHL